MNAFEKKIITETYSLKNGISECKTLVEMKQLIDSLIEQYGENASIHFDSGYNSISEEIKISRLESNEEFETRKKKEISKLENKAKRLKKELNQITEKIKKT